MNNKQSILLALRMTNNNTTEEEATYLSADDSDKPQYPLFHVFQNQNSLYDSQTDLTTHTSNHVDEVAPAVKESPLQMRTNTPMFQSYVSVKNPLPSNSILQPPAQIMTSAVIKNLNLPTQIKNVSKNENLIEVKKNIT